MMRIGLVAASVAMLCVATPAFAAKPPSQVLVYDLSPLSPLAKSVTTHTFCFSRSAHRGLVDRLEAAAARGLEGDASASRWRDEGFSTPTSDTASAILATLEDDARLTDTRWDGTTGDVLEIFVIHQQGADFEVNAREVVRRTRLESDLATLFRVAGRMVKADDKQILLRVTRSEYVLRTLRAEATLTAQSSKDEKVVAGPLEATLTTGPPEHFYLSVNVAITKISELKFNEDSGSLEPSEKPSRPLLGLNGMIGDLLEDGRGSGPLGPLSLGVVFELSDKPARSFGWVVSYRLPPAKWLDLSTVTPFLGWIRTNSDAQSTDGAVLRSASHKYPPTWGVSLNLDKALDWFGGSTNGGRTQADATKPH